MNTLFYDLLQNFVMGGLIIASISYIGTYLSPLLGAIWWSFPISLIPTIYFMKESGKSNKFIANFTLSTSYALILLFISCFFMSYYLKKSNGIFIPIGKSVIVWLIASIIFYYGIKHFKLDDKFL